MKKNKNIIHNIDKTHSEYINEFETNENEIIPSLIKKRDILKSNIKKLKNSQIDEVMNLKDQINEINQEIKTLKSKKRYDTIIYLDVIEHIKNDKAEIMNALSHLKKNGILSYFYK